MGIYWRGGWGKLSSRSFTENLSRADVEMLSVTAPSKSHPEKLVILLEVNTSGTLKRGSRVWNTPADPGETLWGKGYSVTALVTGPESSSE